MQLNHHDILSSLYLHVSPPGQALASWGYWLNREEANPPALAALDLSPLAFRFDEFWFWLSVFLVFHFFLSDWILISIPMERPTFGLEVCLAASSIEDATATGPAVLFALLDFLSHRCGSRLCFHRCGFFDSLIEIPFEFWNFRLHSKKKKEKTWVWTRLTIVVRPAALAEIITIHSPVL